jgi:hypothetical protein
MPSDASILIGWFYRESFPIGTLDFDELLYQAVRLVLDKSDIDTEAYVERNTGRLWNELLESLDIDSRSGRSAMFEVRDRKGRKLVWSPSNIGLASSNKERCHQVRLGTRPSITRLIDNLSDREYEALGCVICQLIGATNVLLTPAGNERGIDFLATINMPSRCHVFGGSNRLFRVVGQAKKYESKVEFKEVQRLNETLNEIKYQTPAMQGLIPPWFHTAAGPIIGWLIAHKGVQSGGVSYARNHGILISDSIDLAEIATLSRQLDESYPADKRAAILGARVNAILSGT